MEAIRYIVDNLYSKFLLRDVFGKIVPGFILILSILAMVDSDTISPLCLIAKLTHTWALGFFLIVLGASWILGFVSQEVLRLIPGTGAVETPIGRLIEVTKAFGNSDKTKFQIQKLRTLRERHQIIAEATGNISISLFLFGVAILVSYCSEKPELGDILAFLFVVVSIILLWTRHLNALNRRNDIDRAIQSILDQIEMIWL